LLAVARIISGDSVTGSAAPEGPIFHAANREPRPGSPADPTSLLPCWRV